jgi:hypothetical protein
MPRCEEEITFIYFKRFDREKFNNGGLIVSKSKRGQDKRNLSVPRTNLIGLG